MVAIAGRNQARLPATPADQLPSSKNTHEEPKPLYPFEPWRGMSARRLGCTSIVIITSRADAIMHARRWRMWQYETKLVTIGLTLDVAVIVVAIALTLVH